MDSRVVTVSIMASMIAWTVSAAAASIVAVTASQAPAVVSSGSITGTVIDAGTGMAVSGATVELDLRGKGRVSAQRTTAQGGFIFTNLVAGEYDLRAKASGYFGGTFRQKRIGGPGGSLALAEAQTIRGATIPVWRLGSISGSVSGEQGEPLVGLTVSLISRLVLGGLASWTGKPTTTRTDDRGHYEFGSVTPGQYLLKLDGPAQASNAQSSIAARPKHYPSTLFYPSADQYALASVLQIASGDDFAADFVVYRQPTYLVSGRLVDDKSSGATVSLGVEDPHSGAFVELAKTVSKPNGSFAFQNMLPGTYRIEATVRSGSARAVNAQSFGPPDSVTQWGRTQLVIDRTDVSDVVIAMRPTVSMKGRVVFRGQPPSPPTHVNEMLVVVTEPNGTMSGGGSITAPVSADGEFEVKGLAPGSYLVQVIPGYQPPGWTLGPITFENRDVSQYPLALSAAGVDGIHVELVKGAEMSGEVRERSGGPDLDASVLAFPVEQALWSGTGRWPPRFRSARVSATGTYLLRDLPPGDYYIVAVKEEASVDWQATETLGRLAAVSKRVHLEFEGRAVQSLTTQQPVRK